MSTKPDQERGTVQAHVGARHVYGHRLETWAKVIRTWRVDIGCSWSRIGELAPRVWTTMQINAMLMRTEDKVHTLGHRLCNFAMKTLGERVEDGWNPRIDESPNPKFTVSEETSHGK